MLKFYKGLEVPIILAVIFISFSLFSHNSSAMNNNNKDDSYNQSNALGQNICPMCREEFDKDSDNSIIFLVRRIFNPGLHIRRARLTMIFAIIIIAGDAMLSSKLSSKFS